MKRLTILVLALALVGCSSEKREETIAQVQKLTVQICSFLPSVKTVSDILSAGNPVVTGATAVAQAICDAVTANPTGVQPATFLQIEDEAKPTEKPCPEVNGVCIQGEFVKPRDEELPKSAPEIPANPPPVQDVPKSQ